MDKEIERIKTTHAGVVYVTRSRDIETVGVVYEASIQGLDTDGGRYAIVCNKHNAVVNSTNKKDAKYLAGRTREFCEYCREEFCE